MDSIRGDHIPSDDESYPFMGREEYLNPRVRKLCEPQTQMLQITGPPMIGKTRTAKVLVRQCLQRTGRDGSRAEAYFVSARGCETMEPVLFKLRVIVQCSPEGDLIEHVKARAKEGVLFLLLDNVEDLINSPRCNEKYMTLCQDLVNCSSNVKLVTTSRRDVMFPRLKPGQVTICPLPPLERRAACDLLIRVVNAEVGEDGAKSIDIGQKMALDIVSHLGRLPLLVITTGCQIRTRDYTPKEILQLLQDKRNGGILTVNADERFPSEDRAVDILAHFTSTLQPILKAALANLNEIPGAFSVEAAMAVNDQPYVALMKQKCILPLNGRHLVTYNKEEDRIDITPVIREFIEMNFEELKDPRVLERFCTFFERQFEDVLSVFHKDTQTAMKSIADDFLKYIKVLRKIQCDDPENFSRSVQLLEKGESQLIQLFPTDMEPFVRRLADASLTLGEQREQGRILMAHGSVLGAGLGRHREASAPLEKAKDIMDGIVSTSNPACSEDVFLLAKAYHHLGSNHFHLSRHHEAIKTLNKSQELLKCSEADEAKVNELLASNHSLLGMTYTLLVELDLAEKQHRCALDIRMKMWGENHPYVGMTLNNLALIYANTGNWDEGLPLFKRGLEIKKQNSGGIATDTVTISMVNVAAGYMFQGQLGMALDVVAQGLNMRKELIWKHWVTACLMKVEGKIMMKQGKGEAAREILKEVVRMRRDLHGEHMSTSGAIKYLADAETMCGDYHAAEKHYLEALDMGRRVLQDLPKNFGLADTYMGLARLKMLQRQPENARMYAEQAREELLRIAEVLGEKSARLAKNCREKLQEVERFRLDGYILDSSSTWLQSQQMALDLCNKNVAPQSHDTAYNSLKQTQSCTESDSLNNLDLKIPSSSDGSEEKIYKTSEKFNISSIERLSLDEENNAVAGSMTEHAPALTNDGHLLLKDQMSPKISNSCDQMFPTDKSVKNSSITNEVKHSNNGDIPETVTQWHWSRKDTRFRTIWRQVAPPTKCRSLESLVSRTWSTSVELPSSIDHPSRIKAVLKEENANDSAKNDNINSQRDIDNNWCDPARFFAGRRLSASCESLQTNLTLTDREGPPTSRESQRVGIPAFSMLFEASNIGGTPNGDDTNLVMEGGHIVEGSTNYSSKYSQTVT